ncbi:MAG TPA: AraC family transcriptional regulator [Fimbriimonas sp.]|nr:AraC family transcriptional regulator [Fimbriimonas sp.]
MSEQSLLLNIPRNGVPRDLHLRPLDHKLSDLLGSTLRPGAEYRIQLAETDSHSHLLLYGVFGKRLRSKSDKNEVLLEMVGKETKALALAENRHFRDASLPELLDLELPDGIQVETVGCAFIDGERLRLDQWTIPVDGFKSCCIKNISSGYEFTIFDAIQVEVERKCPFHSDRAGFALSDLASIVRLRDRSRMETAIKVLTDSISTNSDLDESRSEALTFIAIVMAGMLEAGGGKELHTVQLRAARQFDKAADAAELQSQVTELLMSMVGEWLSEGDQPPMVVAKALRVVSRSLGSDLSDEVVAEQVGLSTSHFRFLFKQAVGKPFHQYLVAARLERAKQLLDQSQESISNVAIEVGFSGLATFSRAFSQRFGLSPKEYRKGRER